MTTALQANLSGITTGIKPFIEMIYNWYTKPNTTETHFMTNLDEKGDTTLISVH